MNELLSMNDLVERVTGAGAPVDQGLLAETFELIMRGELPGDRIRAVLLGFNERPVDGRTLATVAGVLRRHRHALRCAARPLVDTCGTGGDGRGTFNISTTSAFVVAAAGAAVAKHGNRSVSSRSGSSDLIEALGLPLDLDAPTAARLVDATGFTYMHAPAFHPAMRHVMPVRRALGVRTIFNLIGPLLNPAHVEAQVVGVYAPEIMRPVAEALAALGVASALVVHGAGLDEISLHAPTRAIRVRGDDLREETIDPAEFGLPTAPVNALQGGDAVANAEIARGVLGGEAGAPRDVVTLNAAAALLVAGLVPTMAEGLERARAAINAGDAARVLRRVRETATRLRETESASPDRTAREGAGA